MEEILEELKNVRPEMLNENAKKLFDAIMKIADERDLYKKRIEDSLEQIAELYDIYDNTPNYQLCDMLENIVDTLKGESNE